MSYQGDKLDLLPPNATPQERALSLTISRISDIEEKVSNSPVMPAVAPGNDTPEGASTAGDAIRNLWSFPKPRDGGKCPSALLPWLAWTLSVGQWDSTWTDEQKRSVIANAIPVHKVKGSIGSVRRVLDSFGLGFSVKEWQDMTPPGDPYTFNLVVSADTLPSGALASVIAAVQDVIPVRCSMSVFYPAGYTATVNVFALSRIWNYQRTRCVLTS